MVARCAPVRDPCWTLKIVAAEDGTGAASRPAEVRLAGLPMQATSKAAGLPVMDRSPHHTELVAPRVNHACAVRAASVDARGPECHQTLDFGVDG